MVVLTERYGEQIPGVLSCFDRVVITGTLPEICHQQAMARQIQKLDENLQRAIDEQQQWNHLGQQGLNDLRQDALQQQEVLRDQDSVLIARDKVLTKEQELGDKL